MGKELLERALKVMPGGVNSPVRAFKGVGGDPIFMQMGGGANLIDIDKQRYINYVMGWGPLILGNSFPDLVSAVDDAVSRGQTLGTTTPAEVELAELIVRLVPSIDKVRLVNSGTEATMSAVRLARAFTNRKYIVKFTGCYHGHADGFLIEAGSGALTLGVPSSPGVPEEIASLTLSARYNDLGSVEKLFQAHPESIAGVIVEPVAGNMGCVLPQGGFLSGLRDLTRKHGSLLIFDEVITGFRLGLGGAQEYFGVMPDLTCLGKILGGGLPVGAFGGRDEIMAEMAPSGPVYQAGTLSGGPVVTAAALATLAVAQEPDFYERIQASTDQLADGLQGAADRAGVPIQINRIASMLTVFFTHRPVFNFDDVMETDVDRFKVFFHGMLKEGVYLPPSAYECWFVSLAHRAPVIEQTIVAAEKAFALAAAQPAKKMKVCARKKAPAKKKKASAKKKKTKKTAKTKKSRKTTKAKKKK